MPLCPNLVLNFTVFRGKPNTNLSKTAISLDNTNSTPLDLSKDIKRRLPLHVYDERQSATKSSEELIKKFLQYNGGLR